MISDSELLLLCIVIMREQHCWTKNILQALIGRPLLWVFDRQYTNLLSPVHTSDISISTRSIRKQSMTSPLGLVKTKQNAFCSALGLYLDYDDPYVAGLTAFLCQFAFCSFPLCLCYRVNPGFNRFSTYKLPSNSA